MIGVLGMGTVAHGQSATVTVFVQTTDLDASRSSGAASGMKSAFALYEPGRQPRHDGSNPDMPPSPLPIPPAGRSPFRMTTASLAGCGQGDAPPRSLGSRVSRARRAFWPAIAAAECRWNLPAGLMDSLVLAESRYDPSVISPAGAAGLAQLMPSTASSLGVTDRFDPVANVEAGARYLRALLDGFRGNIPLALAAYNAGPSAVRRRGHIPWNGETPGYVDRVLTYWTAPGIGPMSPALSARQTAQMLGFSPTFTN